MKKMRIFSVVSAIVLVIAIVTFINSCLGFVLGGKMKNLPALWLEIAGGIILIILGVKAIL